MLRGDNVKKSLIWFVTVMIIGVTTVVSATPGGINVFINNRLVDSISSSSNLNNENPDIQVKWDESSNSLHINYQKLLSEDEYLTNLVKDISKSVVVIVGKGKSQDTSKYGLDVAHGSGVIISSDGLIVTNAHVVKDMKMPTVILNDGTTLNGSIKFMDTESDLALVKVNKQNLQPAKLAVDSKIQSGQRVIAIGTPLDFSLYNSVTMGVISGINRSIGGKYKFIQTDAPINPGNSGGPLVNLKGEIIGINSMGALYFEGLGFTIPSQTVDYVINQYQKYGKIIMPYTGLSLEEGWQAKYSFPSKDGLRVVKVDNGSPAEKNGIIEDDEIISINKINVYSMPDYYQELRKFSPGDVIVIKFKRQNKIMYTRMTLTLR